MPRWGWSVQKLRLLPPKTQDPKSLDPHESRRAIPATVKRKMAALRVYPAGATSARPHDPAGGVAVRHDNEKCAVLIAPSSGPPSPLSDNARTPRKRRPSAHGPKIPPSGTGPACPHRKEASSARVETRHLKVGLCLSHHGGIIKRRTRALFRP